MNYVVYWIHHPEHLDMSKQGYVGVTKSFNDRMRGHRTLKKKMPVTDAIKTYGWDTLKKTIIRSDLTLEQALALEAELRPTQRIGWNLQKGGEIGVEPEWYKDPINKAAHSKRTSEATKLAIAKEVPGERAERARVSNRKRYCITKQLALSVMKADGLSSTKAAKVFGIGASTLRK